MRQEFDWNDMESDRIQKSVAAIAVYENPHGDLVVRQQAMGDGDDDQGVVIPFNMIDVLAAKVVAVRKRIESPN